MCVFEYFSQLIKLTGMANSNTEIDVAVIQKNIQENKLTIINKPNLKSTSSEVWNFFGVVSKTIVGEDQKEQDEIIEGVVVSTKHNLMIQKET